MSNLEELFLNMSIDLDTFFEGNHLKNDIISYMPKLIRLVFSIRSSLFKIYDLTDVPSNDDIQCTFQGLEDYQITSYVDYFPDEKVAQCHIYSHPYTLSSLSRLTNSFSGGLFPFVTKVSLFDDHLFEHEFFIRIAQSFPVLKILFIDNELPLNHKQYQQANEDCRNMPHIEYPNLTHLKLDANLDYYVELFLNADKVCLSTYINLSVCYSRLRRVTHNFTRGLTRRNCARVKCFLNIESWKVPEQFHEYFPNIEIP